MDPLTAFSLAANILTFAQFAGQLITSAHGLSTSPTGQAEEHGELNDLAAHIQTSVSAFRKNVTFTDDDRLLESLCGQCNSIAVQLQEVLAKITLKPHESKTKAFAIALKSVWKQKEIDELKERLDRISSQIIFGYLTKQQDSISGKLDEIGKRSIANAADGCERSDQLSSQLNTVLEMLQQGNQNIQGLDQIAEQIRQISLGSYNLNHQQQVLATLRFQDMDRRTETVDDAHANTFSWIFNLAPQQSSKSCSCDVKRPPSGTSTRKSSESLELSIPRPRSHFTDFLESSKENFFWISGKPGSGKSTMMKYILDHKTTRQHLQIWTHGDRIVFASFFFWAAGSKLGKSLEGMCRSLLYQLFCACPEALSQFMRPHNGISDNGPRQLNHIPPRVDVPSTYQGLLKCFKEACRSLVVKKTYLLLLLDGLDECDEKPESVADIVHQLSSLEHVKVCASSRHWNQFADRWGNTSNRHIRMQDLTRSDIEQYVKSLAQNTPAFRIVAKTDGQYDQLIHQVVGQAEGVFLWVKLVVKSFLEGVTEGDTIEELQHDIAKLPEDLDAYYCHILDRIENGKKKSEAGRYLLMMPRIVEAELPIACFWYLDKLRHTQLSTVLKTCSAADIPIAVASARRRLNGICKDLVTFDTHVHLGTPKEAVNWVHRTAHDFVERQDVRQRLMDWAPANFDCEIMACELQLVLFRLNFDVQESHSPYWSGMLFNLGRDLRKIELNAASQSRTKGVTRLLECLERDILYAHYQQQPQGFHLLYKNEFSLHSDNVATLVSCEAMILPFCLAWSLRTCSFPHTEWEVILTSHSASARYLSIALFGEFGAGGGASTSLYVRLRKGLSSPLIRLLLRKSAHRRSIINTPLEHRAALLSSTTHLESSWMRFTCGVRRLWESYTLNAGGSMHKILTLNAESDMQVLAEIVAVLLEFGADPNVMVDVKDGVPDHSDNIPTTQITARHILHQCFKPEQLALFKPYLDGPKKQAAEDPKATPGISVQEKVAKDRWYSRVSRKLSIRSKK